MAIIKEFKEFISRGNVIDLAVGVIIGAAFNKIVTSLVNDLIMPPIGYVVGGVNFSKLHYTLKPAVYDTQGKVVTEAVSLNYGNFLQTLMDFMLVAIAIFMLVKVINSIRRRNAEKPEEKIIAPTNEEVLLTDIRDILRSKSSV